LYIFPILQHLGLCAVRLGDRSTAETALRDLRALMAGEDESFLVFTDEYRDRIVRPMAADLEQALSQTMGASTIGSSSWSGWLATGAVGALGAALFLARRR
jgi:hypothetical protein